MRHAALVVVVLAACGQEAPPPKPGLPLVCDFLIDAGEACVREIGVREGEGRGAIDGALEGLRRGISVLREDAARGFDVSKRCSEGLAVSKERLGALCPNVSWDFPPP